MEKSQLKGVEAKTALNEKASAAVRSAERDVEHVLSAQAECEAEGAKLRDVRASLAEMDERGARDEGERNDQVHQIKGLSQRAGHFRERYTLRRPLWRARLEAWRAGPGRAHVSSGGGPTPKPEPQTLTPTLTPAPALIPHAGSNA